MESALRPRDIQARIRAGASIEEVAEAAGMPLARVEVFAAPVIAERDYLSGLARTNPVRRRGETASHRSLRNAIADALAARGIDDESVSWDAWKIGDRRWQVQVSFDEGGTPRRALFAFDTTGRFSVATDDEAARLIGEHVRDELALVHAVQDADPETVAEPVSEAPAEDDADAEDAFQESDLEEVDGIYDIVPSREGELDVLFDMLSSFDEDSVKIYAGLVHPKEAPAGVAGPVVAGPEAEGADDDTDEEPRGDEPDTPLVFTSPSDAVADEPLPEPEQLALIEDDSPTPTAKPRTRRKRASVPSWDEIMFGAPRTDA
ncbi:MAG: septation protein SepH [Propioniciclava sp.]|uniref:septation protein SepH n=1 Tax=Propioniciclava sp. TaxID=2038686 RepID=UPI0039E303C3